jgi:hypothetical protein
MNELERHELKTELEKSICDLKIVLYYDFGDNNIDRFVKNIVDDTKFIICFCQNKFINVYLSKIDVRLITSQVYDIALDMIKNFNNIRDYLRNLRNINNKKEFIELNLTFEDVRHIDYIEILNSDTAKHVGILASGCTLTVSSVTVPGILKIFAIFGSLACFIFLTYVYGDKLYRHMRDEYYDEFDWDEKVYTNQINDFMAKWGRIKSTKLPITNYKRYLDSEIKSVIHNELDETINKMIENLETYFEKALSEEDPEEFETNIKLGLSNLVYIKKLIYEKINSKCYLDHVNDKYLVINKLVDNIIFEKIVDTSVESKILSKLETSDKLKELESDDLGLTTCVNILKKINKIPLTQRFDLFDRVTKMCKTTLKDENISEKLIMTYLIVNCKEIDWSLMIKTMEVFDLNECIEVDDDCMMIENIENNKITMLRNLINFG